MSTTVCKFGGSSLCDGAMFRRTIDIVRSDSDRKYIVLSAPGKRSRDDEKITDLLYRIHGAADAPYIFSRIRERYAQIRDQLCPAFDLDGEIDRMQSLASADELASRGEYLCARLFSAATGFPFVDAAELICFHPDGTLDMHGTRSHIRKRLLPLGRAVIPGFYGSLPDGSIRTFSRGGSDVSGAILAAALDADLYENWTDVDGLFTADPNLLPDARRNPVVSLDQMEKIAHAGANLLHPNSLSVLRGSGIDTIIKNTFSPAAPGTRISETCPFRVKCVTGRRNIAAPVLREQVSRCRIPGDTDKTYCVISAFGLDSAAMRSLHQRLKHVCIIHMQDHFKIITRNDQYETALHIIHQMLHH